MNFVFTTDTIHRGGKERQLFVLADQLMKKGHIVHIVTLKYSSNNYIQEYAINDTCIIVLGKKSLRENYRKYKLTIYQLKPDLVFSWDMQTALFSLFLYKKYRFNFINGSIQHGIRLIRFSQLLRSLILILSPYRIANSEAGLLANNLKKSRRNFVLYNGIERKFENKNDKLIREDKLNQLIKNYILGTKVFISVANFVPYKDYFTVLLALQKLKAKYNFYYLILGDGPMRNQIESKIIELRLDKNVILLGKVENVDSYLKIANVFLHSSRGEGISNAILEGMYAGLPIIATNVGGIPETVYPGSSLLFPYQDDKVLLDCLLKAPEVFASFNPNSEDYRKHLSRFSVENMIRRFEEIIEAVVK